MKSISWRCYYILDSGRIDYSDYDTIDDVIEFSKAVKQSVDVYNNLTGCYKCTIEVLE